jgi:hypothetical protein
MLIVEGFTALSPSDLGRLKRRLGQ